ncbi:hypothetical protein GCM10009603_47940 [Nocardiopsis exhalans]
MFVNESRNSSQARPLSCAAWESCRAYPALSRTPSRADGSEKGKGTSAPKECGAKVPEGRTGEWTVLGTAR